MTSNEQKLVDIFSRVLSIPKVDINDTLIYDTVEEWDSFAHMMLAGQIEEDFNIMLDSEDIISMKSFGIVKEVIRKYGIEV